MNDERSCQYLSKFLAVINAFIINLLYTHTRTYTLDTRTHSCSGTDMVAKEKAFPAIFCHDISSKLELSISNTEFGWHCRLDPLFFGKPLT